MSVRKIIWADTYDDDGSVPQGLMDLNLGVIDPVPGRPAPEGKRVPATSATSSLQSPSSMSDTRGS